MTSWFKEHWHLLDWHNLLSLESNTVMGLSALVFGIIAGVFFFKARKKLDRDTKIITAGMSMMFIGLFIRLFPWSPGMWAAPVGYRYHPLLIEFRHIVYGGGLPLFMIGAWFSMYAVMKRNRWVLHITLVSTLLIGTLFAVSWQASELGHWFDRNAVVESIESFFGYGGPYIEPGRH